MRNILITVQFNHAALLIICIYCYIEIYPKLKPIYIQQSKSEYLLGYNSWFLHADLSDVSVLVLQTQYLLYIAKNFTVFAVFYVVDIRVVVFVFLCTDY
jgi:hypothetical protein